MREDLLRAVRRFTGITLFLSPKIDQRNHCAIDFVIGRAIGSHAQRVIAAFHIPHFPLARIQRLSHVSQNIFQIGDIDIGSEFGDAPADVRGQDVELALFLDNRKAQRALAARRSSIKSRLTSQYLRAERRSLSSPSASADPLSSGISCRHCPEGLLDLCRVRFDLEILQRLRRRAASINIPPSCILSVGVFASRCWNGCANHLGGSRSHSYPD